MWNELWKIKNVPKTASLIVDVLDKDVGNITDDHIGKFTTSLAPGAKECVIESISFRRNRGTFWLHVGICNAPCGWTFNSILYLSDRVHPLHRPQGGTTAVCI